MLQKKSNLGSISRIAETMSKPMLESRMFVQYLDLRTAGLFFGF